ncbi:evolutionarily conserved signaling intermediate in Toll pathway, mitochondrial [Chrysoperla carnea]|uniref:evolutionarily conserved signaling intermediate in Toll pathway, mitochondrial n=1 Tax=Chrysoperla carnea TaxID=189513 RepID=UPI001D080B5E|nr:evolutionarily conserved signaling intermediate in Toll pathway, mitochondrial [Chrysoperla carnea]
MFVIKLYSNCKYLTKICALKQSQRTITLNSIVFKNEKKSLALRDSFADAKDKSKETYLDLIRIFEGKDKLRRGHVEFIATALKHMQDFGVHKDLEAYKKLISVLPKGKFIPQNIFQAEFMHYPKQQQIAIDLLEQMENNGVIPDVELEAILLNIFGHRGYPLRKYWRMMYWMPKFKNLSPWPIPNPVPNDTLELARIALTRMTSVDLQTQIIEYNSADVEDSIDKTWILSAQSPKQKELIKECKITESIYVEGPFNLWLRNASVNYFVLRAEPKKILPQEEENVDDVSNLRIPIYEKPKKVSVIPSIHEQDDGIYLAICATGTSSQDSLLSWIRLMEKDGNPALGKIPVVFTLRHPERELTVSNATKEQSVMNLNQNKD